MPFSEKRVTCSKLREMTTISGEAKTTGENAYRRKDNTRCRTFARDPPRAHHRQDQMPHLLREPKQKPVGLTQEERELLETVLQPAERDRVKVTHSVGLDRIRQQASSPPPGRSLA